jgi:hypothetical protein
MGKYNQNLQDWQENLILQKHADHTAEQLAIKAKCKLQQVYHILAKEDKKAMKPSAFYAALKSTTPIRKHVPYTPDAPKKMINRPPAVYNNRPSPYGIANELHNQKLQK